MKHRLALDIPDTLDTCAMMVRDMSSYSDILPFECPTLQVTPPGWLKASAYELDKGFVHIVTNCNMGTQVEDCDNPTKMVDGVYIVKWSIAPNDKVYVEYNHLRIACFLNQVRKILCCLDLGACTPDAAKEKVLHDLMVYEGMVRAAKAMVEVTHNPSKGMEVYKYAKKKIEHISNTCGCR